MKCFYSYFESWTLPPETTEACDPPPPPPVKMEQTCWFKRAMALLNQQGCFILTGGLLPLNLKHMYCFPCEISMSKIMQPFRKIVNFFISTKFSDLLLVIPVCSVSDMWSNKDHYTERYFWLSRLWDRDTNELCAIKSLIYSFIHLDHRGLIFSPR